MMFNYVCSLDKETGLVSDLILKINSYSHFVSERLVDYGLKWHHNITTKFFMRQFFFLCIFYMFLHKLFSGHKNDNSYSHFFKN